MTSEEIKGNTPHSGYTLPIFASAAAVDVILALAGKMPALKISN
ncbi:hypothetical protein [Oscillatoria salina]|nr:hypothetical protein [Oscillatoria salina]